MLDPVSIRASLLAAVLAHAAATPNREVCGLLFGGPARIDRAEPAANVAPDPRNSFEIDPRALFAALRAERAGGARLIGHYHSHPRGPAEPSARDLAAAEPGRLWLIAAAGVARLWLAEGARFRPLALVAR